MKTKLFFIAVALAAVIAAGFFWFFFSASGSPVGFGWYLFSFAAGLTMIVLPCTLPLVFVIVPLSMGKGAIKGLGIAAAFGLGVALTLSAYGVAAAVIGEYAIGTLGAPLETVKNYLYLFAGAAAYLFALGEIGLLRIRMPTYGGAMPGFIQRQQDVLKALLLGLFLGNIGVGCPHPATPVILTRIAASGDIFYGWLLFFAHAAGRVLPLLFLALLGIMGVNALTWLVARKDNIERATGWGMVFVAAFILVLGLFTHDWWVYSGQHTLFEELTREEQVVGAIAKKIGVAPPHTHSIPIGAGLFGLPLWLGNAALTGLWILPLFWYHFKKKKDDGRSPAYRSAFFLAFSLLFGLLVMWVLPDRFLNHTPHPQESVMPEKAAAHGRVPHGAILQEEQEVREGLAINLTIAPVPARAGTTTRLDFFVHEKPDNAPVPASALGIEHEQLMHVIGVRDDLNEFFHIHPELSASPGLLSVQRVFAKPGIYMVWSEIKKDGVNHAFGHPEFTVEGIGARSEKLVSFGRNVIVGDYQIALRLGESVAAGRETPLLFDAHTLDSFETKLENYLGEKMHLAVIKDDWKQFLHIHPTGEKDHHGMLDIVPEAQANGGGHDTSGGGHGVNFQVAFPDAGLYKVFVQFRPEGAGLAQDTALTAGFWVRVVEEQPFTLSAWWTLLLVSLALMAMLSIGVHGYLSSSHE